MGERPLGVAISALIQNNKILLIERKKGNFIGLKGLPGGKIELDEHVSEAAVREILEESGIESEFKEHLGFVSEHLTENGVVDAHFLLHICKLEPKGTIITSKEDEGNLEWYDLDKIESMKDEIIPSDFLMIKKMVLASEKNYFDCVIEKSGNEHILKKFE